MLNTIQQQLMLVAAVVMGFVVIVGIVLLSQNSDSVMPSEASSKQYTVKKSRDSARGLASSDRDIDHPEGASKAAGPVQSLTPDAKPKSTRIQVPVKTDTPVQASADPASGRSQVDGLITEAYAADGEQAAMDLLARAMAETQSPEDTSRLYAAIGALELAREEPDVTVGLAALRNATESATTPEMRTQNALAEVTAMVLHADVAQGLARIDELLDADGLAVGGAHHLTLMRGDLLVEQGDLNGAEAAYDGVRQAASPQALANDALFRQASLRLARLYARTGDTKKEAIIARDLKRATQPQR